MKTNLSSSREYKEYTENKFHVTFYGIFIHTFLSTAFRYNGSMIMTSLRLSLVRLIWRSLNSGFRLVNLDGVIESDYIRFDDVQCKSNIAASLADVTSHQECKNLCSANANCIAGEVRTTSNVWN